MLRKNRQAASATVLGEADGRVRPTPSDGGECRLDVGRKLDLPEKVGRADLTMQNLGSHERLELAANAWDEGRFDGQILPIKAPVLDDAGAMVDTVIHDRDEGGVVIPVFANWINALNDKLGTPDKVAGNWPMDGDKSHERWWFV